MVDVQTDRKKFAVHVLQIAGLTSYLVSLREVRQPQRVDEESSDLERAKIRRGSAKLRTWLPRTPRVLDICLQSSNLAGAEVGMIIQVWVFAREAKMIGNIV